MGSGLDEKNKEGALMKRYVPIFAVAITFLLGNGCTARYSHSLAGSIPNTSGRQVEASDSGFSLFGIAFSEPKSAHKHVTSLLGACSSLTKVEVDYRETLFVILGIPKVSVKATCVSQ
jgi:hypothetical protein